MLCRGYSIPVELCRAAEAGKGLGWEMGMVLGCRSSAMKAEGGEKQMDACFPCWVMPQGFEVENKQQRAQYS